MTLRAVVVDDEPLARRRIARLLSERDDVELVGEAAGGRAAIDAIARLRPDIVFLDVQMPDIDGFEVLRRLEGHPLPAVVFVTAFDEHALGAFEARAIDYLLKPYPPERFTQAVDRAVRWARREDEEVGKRKLVELLREVLSDERDDLGRGARAAGGDATIPHRPPSGGQHEEASDERDEDPGVGGPAGETGAIERFVVKHRGRSTFVKASDVDWIEAEGNYVRLHVGTADHLVRGTITACAERLDPRRFVRVHRRYIVNLDRVREVQPWFGGDQIILLETGRKLRLSRTFRELFRSRMLGG